MTTQPKAKLRACASCEWIFKTDDSPECPKCGFASYGARYVYGNKAYTYAKNQQPWKYNKLTKFLQELQQEVNDEN